MIGVVALVFGLAWQASHSEKDVTRSIAVLNYLDRRIGGSLTYMPELTLKSYHAFMFDTSDFDESGSVYVETQFLFYDQTDDPSYSKGVVIELRATPAPDGLDTVISLTPNDPAVLSVLQSVAKRESTFPGFKSITVNPSPISMVTINQVHAAVTASEKVFIESTNLGITYPEWGTGYSIDSADEGFVFHFERGILDPSTQIAPFPAQFSLKFTVTVDATGTHVRIERAPSDPRIDQLIAMIADHLRLNPAFTRVVVVPGTTEAPTPK